MIALCPINDKHLEEQKKYFWIYYNIWNSHNIFIICINNFWLLPLGGRFHLPARDRDTVRWIDHQVTVRVSAVLNVRGTIKQEKQQQTCPFSHYIHKPPQHPLSNTSTNPSQPHFCNSFLQNAEPKLSFWCTHFIAPNENLTSSTITSSSASCPMCAMLYSLHYNSSIKVRRW